MSLESVILSMVRPRLSNTGFEFMGQPDSSSWQFSRKGNQSIHYVTFVKSLHRANSLKVQLNTSQEPLGVEHWMLEEPQPAQRWKVYSDETKLPEAIEELVQVVLTRGIQWFDSQG